jgi:hypothetical protein
LPQHADDRADVRAVLVCVVQRLGEEHPSADGKDLTLVASRFS